MSYKVLIIGAGAVGVAMAASLSEEGMDVTVYSKSHTADCIEENGVKRCGIFKDISVPAGKVKVIRNYGEACQAYDYIIISAKPWLTKRLQNPLITTEI